jgi:hypothetical protein
MISLERKDSREAGECLRVPMVQEAILSPGVSLEVQPSPSHQVDQVVALAGSHRPIQTTYLRKSRPMILKAIR